MRSPGRRAGFLEWTGPAAELVVLVAAAWAALAGCGQKVQTTGRRGTGRPVARPTDQDEGGGGSRRGASGRRSRIVGRVPTLSEQDFIEDTEANRDPFRTFFKVPEAETSEVNLEDTRLVLLDRYELSDLTLAGIVGRRVRFAMIRTPDGKTTHVSKGVRISKAKALVVDIADDHIILQVPQHRVGQKPTFIERVLWVDPNRKVIEITAQPLRPDEEGMRLHGWRRQRYLRRHRHRRGSP